MEGLRPRTHDTQRIQLALSEIISGKKAFLVTIQANLNYNWKMALLIELDELAVIEMQQRFNNIFNAMKKWTRHINLKNKNIIQRYNFINYDILTMMNVTEIFLNAFLPFVNIAQAKFYPGSNAYVNERDSDVMEGLPDSSENKETLSQDMKSFETDKNYKNNQSPESTEELKLSGTIDVDIEPLDIFMQQPTCQTLTEGPESKEEEEKGPHKEPTAEEEDDASKSPGDSAQRWWTRALRALRPRRRRRPQRRAAAAAASAAAAPRASWLRMMFCCFSGCDDEEEGEENE